MVMQDPDSQVIASRVGDDVVFGCENLGVPREEMWQRATEALHMVGLAELEATMEATLARPTVKLSGGQKQRLALAGVLAMQPGVIVLDEPTANLDPVGVAEVRESVIAAAESTGATLIVVEHTLSTWADHVDRAIVLGAAHGGTPILADGPIADVLATHADNLVEAGLWVQGIPPDVDPLAAPGAEGGNWGEGAVATIKNLDIGWSTNQPVQQNLNLEVRRGSTVIQGPNGAGKSTLALTLGGLLPPLSGTVNYPAYRPPQPHQWPAKKLVQRVGYVFQDPEHQFAARTVQEELLLGPRATGMDAALAESRADELLETLGLSALGRANPYTLSGGEKRRLSVATVLATGPELVILDEPTFGQDRRTFMAMVRLLQDLVAAGTSVVSISHDATFTKLMAQHQMVVGA